MNDDRRADLDGAFELAGRINEQTLELCDAAADLDDKQLSHAALELRHWSRVVGERLTELRREEVTA